MSSIRWTRPEPKRSAICAAVVGCFGLAACNVACATSFVSNCFDDGRTGSLRSEVAATTAGAVVSLQQLSPASPGCSASTITLASGEIGVSKDNVTVYGSSLHRFTIDANKHSRVFNSNGKLLLRNLTIANGYVVSQTASASGGCIKAQSLTANDSAFTGCQVHSESTENALGGAIYAGDVYLRNSTVTQNSAGSSTSSTGLGGGIYAYGNVILFSTTVSANLAGVPGLHSGIGGGAVVGGNLSMRNSAFISNVASTRFGGTLVLKEASVINSTISGNIATGMKGGGITVYGNADIYNSTVAFNFSQTGGPGLYMQPAAGNSTLLIQSSLLANNGYTGSGGAVIENDLSVTNRVTVTGSHNLVRASNANLPNDTIVGACPLLGRAQNNGGITPTLALQSKSPAIDRGNNVDQPMGLPEDQRGKTTDMPPYAYPRVSGAAADIGAYEIDQSDIVFTSNLEGCI